MPMEPTFVTTPLTPAAIAAQLADPEPYARAMLAAHPDVPADVLDRLSRDPSWIVRRAVAGAVHTPAAALERLAQDPDPLVVESAQDHPGLSLAALLSALGPGGLWEAGASTPAQASSFQKYVAQVDYRLTVADAAVRQQVAQPPYGLWMSHHPDPAIRRLFASYALEVPTAILDRLLADPDSSVASAAARSHPLTPAQQYGLWCSPTDSGPVRLAGATATPLVPDLMRALATHPYPLVRYRLASHPNLDAATAAILWSDPDPRIRAEAAAQVDRLPLTDRQRQAFLTDADPHVRARFAFAFPDETAVIALCQDPDPQVRRALARRDPTEWALQQRLLRDPDPTVPGTLALWTDQPALWDACARHPADPVQRALDANPAYPDSDPVSWLDPSSRRAWNPDDTASWTFQRTLSETSLFGDPESDDELADEDFWWDSNHEPDDGF